MEKCVQVALQCFRTPRYIPLKVNADRISQTFVFVWDLVLVGENGLRSTLNPISFFVWDTLYLGDKKSGRSDLRPP